MDTLFSLWWSSKYEGWLGVESKIPKGVYDYYNSKRPNFSPLGKQQGRDLDTLQSVLMVANCHCALMVIFIPDRTIKSYNNMTGLTSKDIIKRRRSLLLTWSLTSCMHSPTLKLSRLWILHIFNPICNRWGSTRQTPLWRLWNLRSQIPCASSNGCGIFR